MGSSTFSRELYNINKTFSVEGKVVDKLGPLGNPWLSMKHTSNHGFPVLVFSQINSSAKLTLVCG